MEVVAVLRLSHSHSFLVEAFLSIGMRFRRTWANSFLIRGLSEVETLSPTCGSRLLEVCALPVQMLRSFFQ